jgi:protocatechuate 3,4-dioxygenase beta subunit
MKRLLTLFILIAGSMVVQAQMHDPSFQIYITKVDLSGDVTLVWNKPSGMGGSVQYELYRAMVSDSITYELIATTNDYSYVDKVPTVITTIANSYAYYALATSGGTTVKSNVQITPIPGVPLIGSFRLEGKIEDAKVKLIWQKPPVGTVEYYIVHGGNAAIAAPMLPVIDSTVNQWSVTDAPVIFNPGSPVPFHYYVSAKLTTGEVLVSTLLQLTFYAPLNVDRVHFISVPPLFGLVDKPYVYTAAAVSTDSAAVIRYSATFGAGSLGFNFSIDSVTGVVNWTPTAKGMYRIAIHARSSAGGYARQEFTVGIAGGNGIIQGKVTDTLNTPIPNVVVEIFKTKNDLFLSYAYTARTDANGNYKIGRIDPGTYKLKANAPSLQYQSQWYDGKRDPLQADVITVQDSPSVTIANFKLRGGPANLPKVTVSGTVTDSLGLPIGNANCRVVFVRAEFALNIGAGMNIAMENFRKYFEFNMNGDFRLEGNSEYVTKAQVDSSGNYSVQLFPGRYIAFARAKGYSTEFYFEKSDLLSADLYVVDPINPVTQNPPNFTLIPLPPVVLGEIKGAVLDSVLDIPVPSRVIAFRDRWRFNDNHRISRVYVTDTDSTGAYAFSELLPGTYVVMAVPLGNYSPAYYSNNDSVTYRWKRASKIVINGNSVDNINIYVKQLGSFNNGYTNIFGSVTFSGEGNNGLNGKAGAFVYAYRNGEFAGYTMTNAEGKYSINGLAAGYYYVFVDKPGFNESSTVMVNTGYDITGSPLSASADFAVSSTTTVKADPTVRPTEFMLDQNYPNPFNPTTSIRYSLPAAGIVTLKVFDIIGKEVATLVNGFQQNGQYTVTFNASHLSSGMYFYRLETGSMTQVKKMVLLK